LVVLIANLQPSRFFSPLRSLPILKIIVSATARWIIYSEVALSISRTREYEVES